MSSSQPISSNGPSISRASRHIQVPPHKMWEKRQHFQDASTTGKSYHHQRKTKEQAHLNCIHLDVKEYINLPKPSDNEAWKALDDQLYEELPTEIGEMSLSEQLNNLENHVYKRLVDKFGVKPTSSNKADRKTKLSRQKKLRHLKKELKRQFKQALKNGDNVEAKTLKKDFHKIIRLHNKVRKTGAEETWENISSAAQHNSRKKKKKKKTHQFAKKLLNQHESRTPTFQKKGAEKYFSSVNNDKRRDYKYHPLKGMKRPPCPKKPFNTKPPSLTELTNYLMKRRNSSAPGTNRIPYLVWKKCPKTTQFLHEMICSIWRTGSIPLSWRTGEIILISRDENTSDSSYFRPITLKNSSGNLGMGILAQRTIA